MKKYVFTLFLLVFTLFSYGDNQDFDQWKYIDVFQGICKELKIFYVDTIESEKIIKKGIEAMLEGLDPYTNYIPDENMDAFEFITTGEYGGIGALIAKREEGVYISELYEGMPAMVAGLQPGDIFLKIDSIDVRKKDQSQVSKLLRGLNNTSVVVTIKREGVKEDIIRKITRKRVSLPTISYAGVLENGVGYIRLTNFTEKSADEFKTTLKSLKEEKKIQSLILDLRDNPGGILESAIQIVNFFVPKGSPIVSTKGRVRQFNKSYTAVLDPIDAQMPLAILINGGSASASEIVAGAMQDLDRGVLFGSRSFGKGLVQTSRPLPYNGIIKLTSAKYYIPSGRCIQAIDYSHRNADGSVGSIPDSLTHEFKTLKAGRVVKDGGGLVPDVETHSTPCPSIVFQLEKDNLIFDFVTRYYQSHSSIEKPSLFSLTNEEYEEFKEFVKDKNFRYDRQSEKALEKIKEVMKLEGVPSEVDSAYVQFKNALKPNIDRDLEYFKEDIKLYIQTQICKRYYYLAGSVENSLKSDKEIQTILQSIRDNDFFTKVLSKDYKPNTEKK